MQELGVLMKVPEKECLPAGVEDGNPSAVQSVAPSDAGAGVEAERANPFRLARIKVEKVFAPPPPIAQRDDAMKTQFLYVVSAVTVFGLAACDKAGQDTQTAVEKTGDAVAETASGAAAVTEGAWDATKDAAKGTAHDVGASVDAAGAAIRDAAEGTAQDVGASVDAAGAAIKDVAEGVSHDAGATIDAAGASIQTGVEGAYDAGARSLDAAGRAVDDVSTGVWGATEDVGEGAKKVGEEINQDTLDNR